MEADNYANAWLNRDAWPLLPTNIPTAYAVEDQTPRGWEVLSITHGGALDAVNHKVKCKR